MFIVYVSLSRLLAVEICHIETKVLRNETNLAHKQPAADY